MSKYSEEELKDLSEALWRERDKLGNNPENTYGVSRMTRFAGVLRSIHYSYSHMRRKSYQFFPEFQKILRMHLEDLPLYLNHADPGVVAIAKWRMTNAK